MVNNELTGIWKRAGLLILGIIPALDLNGVRKAMKTLIQERLLPEPKTCE
jgi:hypothetical protein